MNWSSISNDVVAATLVNILFTIVITGLVILMSRLIWRRSIRTFFGVQPEIGSISVYLSNIQVNPRGTTGTSQISEGFYGTAITEIEYHYALDLAKSIETKPLYRVIRAFDPGDLFTPAQPIVCKVYVSPTMNELGDPQAIDILQAIKERVGDGSIVLAGAPIYNAFTLHCMNKLGSRFEFIRTKPAGSEIHNHGIRISHPTGTYDDYIRGPVEGSGSRIKEYYIVEKLSWPDPARESRSKPLSNKAKLFVCAGTSSAATAAALQTLADRWHKMAEIQQDENFGLLCEIVLDHKDQRESYPPASELRIRDRYNMPGLA